MSQHRSSDGLLRIVLIIVALVVLLPFLMMALFMPFMWVGGVGMMGDWGMMGGGGIWGALMMVFWFAVLGGLAYLTYRWVTGTAPATTDPALEELRLQYARGELTDEEFDERRSRLSRDE